jgi:LmbE family N-acetylglucosaminyl deacetylase
MTQPLKLMAVLAHPDDESMSTGAILARSAAEGVETCVVTATRGEFGWMGDAASFPGPTALGQIREKELRCSCERLGVRRLELLGYIDGELDQVDPTEAAARIASIIRDYRPHVVITFGPDGAYGHPDHIAISQFTSAAVALAGYGGHQREADCPPHMVSKLYHAMQRPEVVDALNSLGIEAVMTINGVTRTFVCYEDWMITTRVDASAYWRDAWEATLCHQSQQAMFGNDLSRLTDEIQARLWGHPCFYRVYSLVNNGCEMEDDIFAGLR